MSKALYRTHVEGKLKDEIIKDPQRFVELDPDMARTLLDQRDSGKMLLLITNSDYQYTSTMMAYAYDRFLPGDMTWRDLFDMVIVMARKPDFFSYNMSLYEVVTDEGLMKPVLAAKRGGLFCGGSARMVEKALGVEGDDILYVGDHIYTDAALAKINFRWRTALILRELEEEIDALARGRPHRAKLKELMAKKEVVGSLFDHLRLARQRSLAGRRPGMGGSRSCANAAASPTSSVCDVEGSLVEITAAARTATPAQNTVRSLLGCGADGLKDDSFEDAEAVNETLAQLLFIMERLDDKIGPMLEQDGHHFSGRWGFLSRAGLNDKSQLCRQIEKYADVYTSRVSNFMRYTPYAYFRSPSQSLAHDRGLTSYYERVLRDREEGTEDEDQGPGPDTPWRSTGGGMNWQRGQYSSYSTGMGGVRPSSAVSSDITGDWNRDFLTEEQNSDGEDSLLHHNRSSSGDATGSVDTDAGSGKDANQQEGSERERSGSGNSPVAR